MKRAGIHLICEFWKLKEGKNLEKRGILKILKEAARASGSKVVGENFHQFFPYGFSAMVLLAESHISLHFWPEFNYLAIDIFTCGKTKPYQALKVLKKKFKPSKLEVIEIKRGLVFSSE